MIAESVQIASLFDPPANRVIISVRGEAAAP